ncbi:MAG TPA: OmpA family protein, partial [Chthoniobacterales bacterium]
AADPAESKDADMVASMLSAIQDFARDSFQTGAESTLDEFRMGELQVWVVPGRHAYLAAVIRGNPSRELRPALEEAIDSIEILKGSALAKFEGDAAGFASLRPELESCLRAQYAKEKGRARPTRAWFIITVAAAFIAAAIIMALLSESRWSRFIDDLNAQPGIVVTSARQHWFSPSHVSGLRDSAAADPAAVARKTGLDPAQIVFAWKNYLALDDASVERRFRKRFGVPEGAKISLTKGVLTLSGAPPYEWVDLVRRDATLVPGINAVVDKSTKISYDRNLAQERFEARFGRPDGVSAHINDGVLTLSGEASHRWIERVRAEATTLPGITSLDLRGLVDLDQRTFDQSKSIIEHAFIYFLTNKDDIATEGFAALSRLPDVIRRCDDAARRLGRRISLEIEGYADSVGDAKKNDELSQHRAEKVRDFLLSCGFDSAILHPVAMGKQPPAPGEKTLPDQSDRRVALKVVTQPLATKP